MLVVHVAYDYPARRETELPDPAAWARPAVASNPLTGSWRIRFP
jgi:hypothetical protein